MPAIIKAKITDAEGTYYKFTDGTTTVKFNPNHPFIIILKDLGLMA